MAKSYDEVNYDNPAKIIDHVIEQKLKNTWTSLPANIVSFNAGTQTATVKIAVKQAFLDAEKNREYRDYPTIREVPVLLNRAGGWLASMPIKPGDACALMFCSRSIDDWFTSGTGRAVSSERHHHLNDCFAIMGLSSQRDKVTDYDNDNFKISHEDGNAVLSMTKTGQFSFSNGVVDLMDILVELLTVLSAESTAPMQIHNIPHDPIPLKGQVQYASLLTRLITLKL